MDNHYVVIGSGVAGMSAADEIFKRDSSAHITILSEDPHRFYSRPGLPYLLSSEIPEKVLFPLCFKEVAKHVTWINDKVKSLHPSNHLVDLEKHSPVTYDRLLLATGSESVSLSVPGAKLEGVHKLDHLEDARAILSSMRSARSAVVVGGGITALEMVEALHVHHIHVVYFLRGNHFWSNTLSILEAEQIEKRLKSQGIKIEFQTELSQIEGRNGHVSGVISKDGRRFDCDLLIYAIGVLPRVDLALTAGLKIDRGILVTSNLQTSDSDIYASGDVAEIFNPLSGQTSINTLWAPARQQGLVAGANMTGAGLEYTKGVSINVTRLAGLTTAIIGSIGNGSDLNTQGISRGDSESWHNLTASTDSVSGSKEDHLRICLGDDHILGALVIGDQKISYPLSQLIQFKANIQSIRRDLLQASSPNKIIMNLFNDWRLKHAASQFA